MIANFFQSLDRNGVEYLLISGQATVLYGAATFSEDIDLWINPAQNNLGRFLSALRQCRARYYKLTPPFTSQHLERGHGFHFTLPVPDQDDVFLDVMGNPPRVGSFAECVQLARWIETEWGNIHTIGIKSLVELKKTQRLEDYPIISKLVLACFDQPGVADTAADFLWALNNIFTLPELATFFTEHSMALEMVAVQCDPDIAEFGRQVIASGEVAESVERRVEALFRARVAEMQLADRRYWREIIRELKVLSAASKLMPVGHEVSVSSY